MANSANAAGVMVDEDGIGCQLSSAGPEVDRSSLEASRYTSRHNRLACVSLSLAVMSARLMWDSNCTR
jgi:hypothetical protein